MWTDEETERFLKLIADALAIQQLIRENGGNPSKSVVEDVLMNAHSGLERPEAHDVLNHIEFHDMRRLAKDRIDLDLWRAAFVGVDVRWYDGDPFDGLAKK